MEQNKIQEIPLKSSLRNNILIAFFIVLTLTGTTINIIFLNAIKTGLMANGLETNAAESIMRHLTIIGTGSTIAGTIIILVAAFFLSRAITRPIKKLTRGMADIADGCWGARVEIENQDEFGRLAEGFNSMSEQIKDALEKVKASRDYTDNIIMSVPSMLIVMSKNLKVLSTNKKFSTFKEKYPAFTLEQLIDPLKEDIRINLGTGENINREMSIVPKGSDSKLIFSAVVSPMGNNSDPGEEEARILLTITDITVQKKMKEMVLQSRQDWEDTFNIIPDIITIHDMDHNIIHANKAAMEVLGLPELDPGETIKCYKYFHDAECVHDKCTSNYCCENKVPVTVEMFEPKLNKYLEIRSIPRISKDDEIVGLIHIVRDISLRKEIEKEHNGLLLAITKAKTEWELTFDSLTEFVVLIDKGLKITRCNKSFAEFAGVDAKDIVGHRYDQFFPGISNGSDDDLFSDQMTRNEIQTLSGRWLYVSHRPVNEDSSHSIHSVIVATEITDLKKTQEQLTESEKELKLKIEDLENFYNLSVGRELRMKELKKEIKRLNKDIEKLNNHSESETYEFIKK